MKKLCLLLALVLCMGIFAACSVNGSPEAAAKAYCQAYLDYDFNKMSKVCMLYNEDVIEMMDIDEDEKQDYLDLIEETKEKIEENKDELDDSDIDIDYSIENVEVEDTYTDGDDKFDDYLENLEDLGLDNKCEEIARVKIEYIVEFGDNESELDRTVTVYNIDGKWYVID